MSADQDYTVFRCVCAHCMGQHAEGFAAEGRYPIPNGPGIPTAPTIPTGPGIPTSPKIPDPPTIPSPPTTPTTSSNPAAAADTGG